MTSGFFSHQGGNCIISESRARSQARQEAQRNQCFEGSGQRLSWNGAPGLTPPERSARPRGGGRTHEVGRWQSGHTFWLVPKSTRQLAGCRPLTAHPPAQRSAGGFCSEPTPMFAPSGAELLQATLTGARGWWRVRSQRQAREREGRSPWARLCASGQPAQVTHRHVYEPCTAKKRTEATLRVGVQSRAGPPIAWSQVGCGISKQSNFRPGLV